MNTSNNPVGVFAANLRRLQQERGWTSKELIQRCGVSGARMYLSGRTNPTATMAQKFADAFGVSVADLFRESPE